CHGPSVGQVREEEPFHKCATASERKEILIYCQESGREYSKSQTEGYQRLYRLNTARNFTVNLEE
ncbi:MAG: hypothetical protein ABFD82_17910, partial [Syntrophaceae bacterium]